MKNRHGFVSNSSSSSYIVNFPDLTFDQFSDIIGPEYEWDWLNKDRIQGEIKNRLKDFVKFENEYKEETCDTLRRMLADSYAKAKDKLKAQQEAIEKAESKDELTRLIFEYWQIRITEDENGLTLDYYTTMHNDFVEGMGEVMAEIVLFFSFMSDVRMICERVHDE